MLKVGITGGIGSGKSVICKIFKQLQIPVYDADTRAKVLLNEDSRIKNELIKLFGSDLYQNNQLDKKKLSQIIFSNPDALHKVNRLIHPAVADDFDDWMKSVNNTTYIIKEAAILFESGADKGLDYTINISCPEEVRIQRVMKRDHVTREKVLDIIKTQFTDVKRTSLANFSILNDETKPVVEEVLKLHNYFLEKNKQ